MSFVKKEMKSLDLNLEAHNECQEVNFNFDPISNSPSAGNEDDDWVIKQDADKTGFAKWIETLTSRVFTDPKNCCVGRWCSELNAIEILQQKGKKHFSMGFFKNGVRYFHPVEALWLLDEGSLLVFTLESTICDTKLVQEVPTAPEKVFVNLTQDNVIVTGTKRERDEESVYIGSEDLSVYRAEMFMPFSETYMFLVSKLNWDEYVVYSHLRSSGFVVLPHLQADVSKLGSPQPVEEPLRNTLLPYELPLVPIFDVYVRDGITSFRPSAPGPPDFFLILVSPSTPTPSPAQISDLDSRLTDYIKELKNTAEKKMKTVEANAYLDKAVVKAACVSDSIVTLYSLGKINIHPQKSIHSRPIPVKN